MSWRLALVFFALTLLTRAPFQTQNLWAHDSVLYERAIERFDPLDQRPQPPGYLYYVLAIRALDALTGDANRAMTLLSFFADAAAVALLYVLAARLYDERTARISALFLLSAVTFWAYGGIAYPYTLLAALSIASALLFWRTVTTRRGRDLFAASAFWGIAVGFRSDLAIFLAPLWLVAAAAVPLASAVLGALVVAGLVGVWYVASAAADGGIARFGQALAMQGQFVNDRYSVFGSGGLAALYANLYELGRFLGRGLYFLAPLLAAVPLSAAARHIELADRRRTLFVLLWALTPLLIYVPIHSGEYGYVFSMLPGLCVIAARGAIALARGLRMPRTLPWIVATAVLANSAIFLLSDTALSARDLARRDFGMTEKAAALRADDLRDAVVITAYDALLVERYVGPSHRVIAWDPVATPTLDRSVSGSIVVVWDDLLRIADGPWQTRVMPHGSLLRIARVDATWTLHVRDGLEVSVSR